MYRSLRIATGILVLLALVFGMGVASEKAYAADGPDKQQPKEVKALPIDPADQDGAPNVGSPITNTATKTTYIKTSTTISGTKTYTTNVSVYPGATLTVGTNAKVTINGDLYIGGSVVMTSGTLTVNGDIWAFGKLTVKGTAKVIVNKAPVSGNYGGGLIVSDAGDYGALMTVSGSANITITYVSGGGFFVQDNARIKVDSASAKITVNNRCYFGWHPPLRC